MGLRAFAARSGMGEIGGGGIVNHPHNAYGDRALNVPNFIIGNFFSF